MTGNTTVVFFDYTKAEPYIVVETDHWAVVYKPPRLPTAPLRKAEEGTLVHWFLNTYPASGTVRGRKDIEAGLLHRLDTDTRGLVLFAKDQQTYEFFSAAQEAGRILKTYHAFARPAATVEANKVFYTLPYTIASQFRNFGPGAKRAAAVFPESRQYKKEGRIYRTDIIGYAVKNGLVSIQCRLSRGYRHQVRVHLATLGFPIAGDPLYGSNKPLLQSASAAAYGLQLYALGLSMPDPENPKRNICVALPPPDKMSP